MRREGVGTRGWPRKPRRLDRRDDERTAVESRCSRAPRAISRSGRSTKSLNCTRRERLSIMSSRVNKSFVSSHTCIVHRHGLFFVFCVTLLKAAHRLGAGVSACAGDWPRGQPWPIITRPRAGPGSIHARAWRLDRLRDRNVPLARRHASLPRRRHGQRNHRVAHSPGPLPARGELAPHLQDVAGQRRASSHPAIRSRRVDSSAIVPRLARDAASDPARLPDPRPRASLLLRSCRDSSATADA